MTNLVADFGAEILREDMKTDEFFHVLTQEQKRINARRELVTRQAGAPLDEESVFTLIMEATGIRELAEKIKARFILEKTKKDRQ